MSKTKSMFKMIVRNMKFTLPLLCKKSPITIVCIILSSVIGAVQTMINVVVPALIIEELINMQRIPTLVLYVGILMFSRTVINIIANFIDEILDLSARKVDFIIDEMFNKKIMGVDYFNVEDPQFIDRMNRAKKGMNQYSNGIFSFIYSMSDIIYSILTIAGVIGIILASGQYVIIVLAVLALISNTIIYRKIQNINQEFRNQMIRTNRRMFYYNKNIANFRNQKELRLYHGKELIQEATEEINPPTFKKYSKYANRLIKYSTVDSIIYFLLSNFLTIIYLGYSVVRNFISVSTFTMIFNGIKTLDNATSSLVYSIQDYAKACEYQEDFIDLMEMESEFVDGDEPIDKIETIEFKNVSFKYPRTENYILKDVSFTLNNLQKTSLVGLNGAGKTTIIKLLCRFYKVEEGEILINGKNINNYNYSDFIKQLAIVFQDFKIISFSVKSNIAIVDENKEKLDDVLSRAQVIDKINSLPNKENTYINKWFDKTGVEFSGGEMQKFAIARCLYKDSDFVVLDEPTSALDPVAEAQIYYNFNDIVGRKLTLFISHRLSSCIFSNIILVLDGNQIVEEGTHKELMNKKDGLYYQMFTAQAEYYQD